jgi:uncharacterized protein (TIGR02145 family)
MGKLTSEVSRMLKPGKHQFKIQFSGKGLFVVHVSNGSSVQVLKVVNLYSKRDYSSAIYYKGGQGSLSSQKYLSDPDPDAGPGIPCPELPFFSWQGKTYTTVLIGGQCWMAQNLDVGTMISGAFEQTDNALIEKYCYSDDPSYCEAFGGLYQWDEIMKYALNKPGVQGICPDGFHIPTDEEWKILEGSTDSEFGVGDPEWDQIGQRGADVATHLKTTGWLPPDNGTDDVNFGAQPSGIFHYAGYFTALRSNGRFWTSNKGPAHGAWYRSFNSGYNTIYRNNHGDRDSGFSLRCIKND